jgi:hypothetical protein
MTGQPLTPLWFWELPPQPLTLADWAATIRWNSIQYLIKWLEEDLDL